MVVRSGPGLQIWAIDPPTPLLTLLPVPAGPAADLRPAARLIASLFRPATLPAEIGRAVRAIRSVRHGHDVVDDRLGTMIGRLHRSGRTLRIDHSGQVATVLTRATLVVGGHAVASIRDRSGPGRTERHVDVTGLGELRDPRLVPAAAPAQFAPRTPAVSPSPPGRSR